MQHVVKSGQSLWSIAKDRLGAGASNADIKTAANQIADASGIARNAQLSVGQKLNVPDAFEGIVRGSASGDAVSRLTTPQRPAGVQAQAAHRAQPLLNLKAVFSDARMEVANKLELPDIAGVKVDATRMHFLGVRSMIHDDADYTVDAKLGKLSQQQFDDVSKAMGAKSTVKFDAAREYTVADFLPPAVQALLHRDLEVTDPVTLKGTKNIGEDLGYGREDHQVDLTMNCHATAWEAARAFQGQNDRKVSVFYGEMITMDLLVSDDTKFKTVGELKADKAKDILQLDLKPGDIVQFFNDGDFMMASTNLLHSAVYAGGGLFFEKPNTEGPEKEDRANYVLQEETLYRLATPEMMTTPLSDTTEGKFKIVVRRPLEHLPPAEEAFGSSLQKDFDKFAQKKGRELGVKLVSSIEQGMGGNVRGEHVSALVEVPLKTGTDGTVKLDV